MPNSSLTYAFWFAYNGCYRCGVTCRQQLQGGDFNCRRLVLAHEVFGVRAGAKEIFRIALGTQPYGAIGRFSRTASRSTSQSTSFVSQAVAFKNQFTYYIRKAINVEPATNFFLNLARKS